MTYLPDNLRGRNIYSKVIPTVCNVKNMLDKLTKISFDYQKIKQWERRSYDAYQINKTIEAQLLKANKDDWGYKIKEHILHIDPLEMKANIIDIYLVAYVTNNIGIGFDVFANFIIENNISRKIGSARNIWQVGKGDGVYLNILHDNGVVKDWDFMIKWISGKK